MTDQTTETVNQKKEPSKKSQAHAIFVLHMDRRNNGEYSSNRDFRAAVLSDIQEKLGVSLASAATMYNTAKKDAESSDPTVSLGRDPKKETEKVAGKRGRPAGSKNKKPDSPDALNTSTLDATSDHVQPAEIHSTSQILADDTELEEAPF